MATLTPSPKMQFFDANGNPLNAGLLYTYAAGTTTPLATYTDSGAGTSNANPIVLDPRGEASVWLGTSLYYMELRTSTGGLIWSADNVGGVATLSTIVASSGASVIGFIQSGSGAVATTVQSYLRQIQSPLGYGGVANSASDQTAALQAAHDACGSSGFLLIPEGTWLAENFRITKSNITIICAGVIKPLTTTSTAVIIGKNSSGQTVATRGLRGNLRVASGSSFATYTGATGIDVQFLYESDLLISVTGCDVGIDFSPSFLAGAGATGGAISYNNIRYGDMTNNKIARRIDPQDASSWVNENHHLGGRFSIDSGTYTAGIISDQITVGVGGNTPNGNLFIKPSYEGAGQCVNSRGIHNHWIDPRYEITTTGTPGVDYATTYFDLGLGSREQIDFGSTINMLTSGTNDLGAGTSTGTRSFTMVGDFTTQLFRGQIAALTIAATDYGCVITESSYAAPNTTVRVSRPIVSGNPTAIKVPRIVCADGSSQNNTFTFSRADLSSGGFEYETWHRKTLALLGLGGLVSQTGSSAFPAVSLIPSSSTADRGFRIHNFTDEVGWIDHAGNSSLHIVATQASPASAIDLAPATNNVAEAIMLSSGVIHASVDSDTPLRLNRKTNDGVLILFNRDGSTQGSISVAGGVVTLNAFNGSHWSQLVGNEYISDLPIGTVLEGTDEMCQWPDSPTPDNRLCRTVICDTIASKRVQGTFQNWDIMPEPIPPTALPIQVLSVVEEAKQKFILAGDGVISPDEASQFAQQHREELELADKHAQDIELYQSKLIEYAKVAGCNDLMMGACGRGWVRMAPGSVVELGDLVEPAGAGCARVQMDDVIRASTIGRIEGTHPAFTHPDGSFTVVCGLLIG